MYNYHGWYDCILILTQALMNLANISGKRIAHIFAALERRLKPSDKKERLQVKGQEGDAGRKRRNKEVIRKTSCDKETSSTSTSNTVSA